MYCETPYRSLYPYTQKVCTFPQNTVRSLSEIKTITHSSHG